MTPPNGRSTYVLDPARERAVKAQQGLANASATRSRKPPVTEPVGSIMRTVKRILAKADLPNDNQTAERARMRRKTGLGIAGGGYLLASRAKEVAPGAVDLLSPSEKKIGAVKHAEKILTRSAKITRVSGKTGAALVGLGLAAATEGAVSDLHARKVFSRTHSQAQQKAQAAHSQVQNMQQKATGKVLAKAFDSEASRHGRSDAATGGLVGGSVVAGAKAVQSGRAAKPLRLAATAKGEEAKAAHLDLQSKLQSMGQSGKTPKTGVNLTNAARLHRQALGTGKEASGLARGARNLTRISRGSAAGAAALAAAAVGVHHYDRRGGGRTYGY